MRSDFHLWNNIINCRRQAFGNIINQNKYVNIKLLEKNPPQMPWRVLPRMIKNETKEGTEIQTLLSVEKIKSETHLQDLRSEKY